MTLLGMFKIVIWQILSINVANSFVKEEWWSGVPNLKIFLKSKFFKGGLCWGMDHSWGQLVQWILSGGIIGWFIGHFQQAKSEINSLNLSMREFHIERLIYRKYGSLNLYLEGNQDWLLICERREATGPFLHLSIVVTVC